MKSVLSLRRFNNALSVLVVLLCLYIIVLPLLPQVIFWGKARLNIRPALVKAEAANITVPLPAENTLVIPSLNMQEAIYEGNSEAVLMKGVWHRPFTSSPDKGGNTVLSGHRYTYAGAAEFYHLDKIRQGDSVIMYWQGKKYQYTVKMVREVPPEATEIEAPTNEATLTIYTCTPLWTAKNRLIITAELVGEGS
jgi:sortase A